MDKTLTRLGLGLGAVAIIVAMVQASKISDLERRLVALASREPAAAAQTDAAAAPAAYDDTLLEKRIAALEKQLAAERVMSKAVARAAVATRPRPQPNRNAEAATGEVADEVTSLRADVDALLTGAGVNSDEGKKQITDLVKKVREQERTERQARWTEFRKKRDEEFISTFAKEAGLDEDTTNSVSTIVGDFRTAQMKLRLDARNGTLSFEDMRAQRQELRAQTDKKLGEVLTEQQLKDFNDKMREERRGGGRRGGGRRGGF